MNYSQLTSNVPCTESVYLLVDLDTIKMGDRPDKYYLHVRSRNSFKEKLSMFRGREITPSSLCIMPLYVKCIM